MKCNVKELVGGDAITLEDGQTVFDAIKPELERGGDVILDFGGVSVFTSLFFNAAIGQLLKSLKPSTLNKHLKFDNLSPEAYASLLRVIENSKQYYSSPNYRDAQIKVLEDLSKESK